MSGNPNRSLLDKNEIFQRAFDESTDRLRTDAATSLEFNGELAVEVDAADGDNIAIADPDSGLKANVTNVSGAKALSVKVENQIESQPSGLSIGLKVSRMTINDIPQMIPGTNLLNRNTMSIRVLGTNTVFFGAFDVTSTAGYPKFQYEELSVDIKDNSEVTLYGVCESGKECEIAIFEIA